MEALMATVKARWTGTRLEGMPASLASAGVSSAAVLLQVSGGALSSLVEELVGINSTELTVIESAELERLDRSVALLAAAEQRAREAEPFTGLADVVEVYKRRKLESEKNAALELSAVPPPGLRPGGRRLRRNGGATDSHQRW